jgi:hypothetical protein
VTSWPVGGPWAIFLTDRVPRKDGDMTTTTGLSYSTAANQFSSADYGIDYA